MSGFFVYAGIIGFLVGVAVRSVLDAPVVFAVLVGCVGVMIGVVQGMRRQRVGVAGAVSVFFIFVCIGVIRANSSFSHTENFLDGQLGHAVLEGMVVTEPIFTEKSQKIVLKVSHEEEMARVSVIAPPFPEFSYGDTVRATGNLKKPESFETDSGAVFNYPEFLAKDGIFHQMVYPKTELLSSGGGQWLYRGLFFLRKRFIETVETHLPEPNAGLLAGIAIGAQDGMDSETEEMFRRVGLIHIVVLSGYNITVVSDTVMRLFAFLPRTVMLTSGGIIVALFVLMTGATATAVRAGSMAILALAARFLGARYDIARALFVVAFVMVLLNPHVLVFDPSFQLSFLATFGLITLSLIIEKKSARIPNTFSLRQTISATLATQVFVLPLLVHMSGEVSLVSLLANVVVLPIIPFSMFFTYLLGIFGSFVSPLAIALSFPTFFISEYILRVSDWFASLPFAVIETHPPSWWVLAGIYGVLVVTVIRARARTTRLPDSS